MLSTALLCAAVSQPLRKGGKSVFPLQRLRADTPSTASALHLNAAGASPPPLHVIDRMCLHLEREGEVGGYRAAAEVALELEGVYDSVARLLGCERREVALAESASAAWTKVFYSAARELEEGDEVLVHSSVYAADFVAATEACDAAGARVVVMESDESGAVCLQALRRRLREKGSRVRMVLLTHIPTNGGLVNDAAGVGRELREAFPDAGRRPFFLLDACQSIGQMPVDVRAIGCDALTATGRKYLRGPRGTGFLFCSSEAMERLGVPAIVDHFGVPVSSTTAYAPRPDARRFEMWESSVAARLGLGMAVSYALGIGLDRIHERVKALAEAGRELLGGIDGVTVRDIGAEQCGIISLEVEKPQELADALASQNVFVAVCPPTSTPFDSRDRDLPQLLRISLHYYNTESELQILRTILASTLPML